MCTNDDFVQVKFECDDSNFSNSFTQDEEQCDTSQLGEPTIIKTMEGGTASVQLRPGNKLLYASGKFFCIEHTTNFTDYQKENTGIVCICHHCGARIKGSLKVSSNFICHLKNKHPEVYQDFLKQKSAHSASYIRAPKVSNDVHRSSPYPAPTPILNNILHNNEKQEQFHHNVLKFLVATNQSFDVVVDPNFSKLFEFLSFPVQMRPPDYYEKMVKDACDYKRIELFQTFSNSRAYVCNSVDSWSYRGCSYMAVACHWIDEHYQRQASLLTCRRAKRIDDLSNVQSEILQRYGIISENITASTTSNVHSFQNDFIQFGISKEVFAQDHCFASDEDPNSLQFLSLEYQHLIKLDILKLNEIWGQNFVRKLNDNLKVMHRSVMEKCSNFWLISLSKDFQLVLQTILSEPITRPNILNLTSLYQSIKQLLTHSDKLDQIFCLMSKPGFTPVELEYLSELQELFEPLSAAFAFLDMPQNNYYGCFLPTLVTLKWKLTRLYNSNKLVHLQGTLATMKEELLKEFEDYYELNESKSEAIIAALTYPPVKTRFAMGLNNNTSSYTFQLQNILRKYGSEYHVVEDQKGGSANHFACTQQGYMDNSSITSTDFFDFGDTAVSSVPEDITAPYTLRLEIDTYLSDTDISLLSLQKYPTIRRMFYRYNTCIPSPSTALRHFPLRKILTNNLTTDEQFENYIYYNQHFVN